MPNANICVIGMRGQWLSCIGGPQDGRETGLMHQKSSGWKEKDLYSAPY